MSIESASKANQLFGNTLKIKREVKNLNEHRKNLEEHLLGYVQTNGPTLVYNAKDKPIMLYAREVFTTKLDKAGLASKFGLAQKDLTEKAIVRLVEDGVLSVKDIEAFEYQEKDMKLKTRKPTEEEIDKFNGVI